MIDKDKQIKSTDWLTKNYSKEELAEMKAKADKEAEEELKQKQIDEMAREIAKRDCYLYEKCPKPIKHNCVSQDPAIMMESSKNYITIATWLVRAGYRKERVGEWISLEPEIGLFACSLCDHRILRAKCNYCPHCGARMKGE